MAKYKYGKPMDLAFIDCEEVILSVKRAAAIIAIEKFVEEIYCRNIDDMYTYGVPIIRLYANIAGNLC